MNPNRWQEYGMEHGFTATAIDVYAIGQMFHSEVKQLLGDCINPNHQY